MAANLGTAKVDLQFEAKRGIEKAQRDLQRKLGNQKINIKSNIDRAVTQPLGKATGKASEFSKALQAAESRILAFSTIGAVFFGIGRGLSEVVRQTIKVEDQLTQINTILNSTQKNLQGFSQELFNIGRQTGQSFSTAADAANELARQGLGLNKTLQRTKDALILGRLSGLDMQNAVEAVTAAINSFNKAALDSTTVVNRLANVDAAFAVSQEDLAKGIRRASAAADSAEVSFNQLLSLISVAQQRTARGGRVIGNAFKTIFTRLQRTSTLDQLEQLNIKVRDLQGEALPAVDILKNMANSFDRLTDSQEAAVAELVGGVFRINTLKAVLGDLTKRTSEYNRAMGVLEGTTNQANQRNQELEKTLSSLLQDAANNLTEVAAGIGKFTVEPLIRNVVEPFNAALQTLFLQDVESPAAKFGRNIGKGLLTGLRDVISGPATLLSVLGIGGAFAGKALRFAGRSGLATFGFGEDLPPEVAARGRRIGLANVFGQQKQPLSKFQQFIAGGFGPEERVEFRNLRAGRLSQRQQKELRGIIPNLGFRTKAGAQQFREALPESLQGIPLSRKPGSKFKIGEARGARFATELNEQALREGRIQVREQTSGGTVTRPTKFDPKTGRPIRFGEFPIIPGDPGNRRQVPTGTGKTLPINQQPGRFRQFLTNLKARNPLSLLGGSVAASFAGGAAAGLFDQQTRQGRIGGTIASGAGQTAAGIGLGSLAISGPAGPILGGLIAGLASLGQVVKTVAKNTEQYQQRLQKLDEIQTRLSETAVEFFRVQETLGNPEVQGSARRRARERSQELIQQFPEQFQTQEFLRLFREGGKDSAKEFLDSFKEEITAKEIVQGFLSDLESRTGFLGLQTPQVFSKRTVAQPGNAFAPGNLKTIFTGLNQAGQDILRNRLGQFRGRVSEEALNTETQRRLLRLRGGQTTREDAFQIFSDIFNETNFNQIKEGFNGLQEKFKLSEQQIGIFIKEFSDSLIEGIGIEQENQKAKKQQINATEELERVFRGAKDTILEFQRSLDLQINRRILDVQRRTQTEQRSIERRIAEREGLLSPQERIRLQGQQRLSQAKGQFQEQRFQTIGNFSQEAIQSFNNIISELNENKGEFGGAVQATKKIEATINVARDINQSLKDAQQTGNLDPQRFTGLVQNLQQNLDDLSSKDKFEGVSEKVKQRFKDLQQNVKNSTLDGLAEVSKLNQEQKSQIREINKDIQLEVFKTQQGRPAQLREELNRISELGVQAQQEVIRQKAELERENIRQSEQTIGELGRVESRIRDQRTQLINSISQIGKTIQGLTGELDVGSASEQKRASEILNALSSGFTKQFAQNIREGNLELPFNLVDEFRAFADKFNLAQPVVERIVDPLKQLQNELKITATKTEQSIKTLRESITTISDVIGQFQSGLKGGRSIERTIDQNLKSAVGNARKENLPVSPLRVGAAGFLAGFETNFTDVLDNIRSATMDLANTMRNSFSDAFSSFIRGAKSAEDAFRSFGLSVLNRIADISAQITTNLLFSTITQSTGISGALQGLVGNIGTGGVAGFSQGGVVKGGSGVRDDVPAMLNEGEFVLRKKAVENLGVPFLRALNQNKTSGFQVGGSAEQTLTNKFAVNDPKQPTKGATIADPNLSNFALSNRNNPQNRIRFAREKAFANFQGQRRQFEEQLSNFEDQQQQRITGALINSAVQTASFGALRALNRQSLAEASGAFGKGTGRNATLENQAVGGGPLLDPQTNPTPKGLFNKGGVVGQDNVPSLLTGGEFVLNKQTVDTFGVPFLSKLNKGQVKKFQTGGFVGDNESAGSRASPAETDDNLGSNLEELLSVAQDINNNLKSNKSQRNAGQDNQGQVDGSRSNGQPNITMNFNIGSNGDTNNQGNQQVGTQGQNQGGQSDQQNIRELASRIEGKVKEVIKKEQRDGGLLDKSKRGGRF